MRGSVQIVATHDDQDAVIQIADKRSIFQFFSQQLEKILLRILRINFNQKKNVKDDRFYGRFGYYSASSWEYLHFITSPLYSQMKLDHNGSLPAVNTSLSAVSTNTWIS